MRFCTIASGSSGNCVYVGSTSTHILVDAGCSRKKIVEGLQTLDLTLDDIDAVFLTHEHSDHTSGLKTLLKHCDAPVYATAGTAQAVQALAEHPVRTVRAHEAIRLKELTLSPFAIPHDAAEPVCYRIENGTGAVALATDMGCFNEDIIHHLKGVDLLLIEANHDVRMLQTGPYPWHLKQRILGDKGHLSNDSCGQLLQALLHDGLSTVVLGHLSECNNLPELAYETVRLSVEMGDNPYHASDFRFVVADRRVPSRVMEAGGSA